MKETVKKVYYCDFCKKRYLSKNWAIVHEKHCTKNPNRYCRMCDQLLGGQQDDFPKLVEKYKNSFKIIKELNYLSTPNDCVEWQGKPITLLDISDSVEGCPMCILTILRLAFNPSYYFGFFNEFDYEKRLKETWDDFNSK